MLPRSISDKETSNDTFLLLLAFLLTISHQILQKTRHLKFPHQRKSRGLNESYVKARERVKIFNEALSVLNNSFSSVPSKKRFRSEGFANDRFGTLLSSDQSTRVNPT